MTIVNDDSSVVNKQSFKLIDDARVVIYDRNRFIIPATGDEILQVEYLPQSLFNQCFFNDRNQMLGQYSQARLRMLTNIRLGKW